MAEDPLHFVLRVEAFFGEKRVPLSRDLLHLQKKFAVPSSGPIYRGERPREEKEEGRERACIKYGSRKNHPFDQIYESSYQHFFLIC